MFRPRFVPPKRFTAMITIGSEGTPAHMARRSLSNNPLPDSRRTDDGRLFDYDRLSIVRGQVSISGTILAVGCWLLPPDRLVII